MIEMLLAQAIIASPLPILAPVNPPVNVAVAPPGGTVLAAPVMPNTLPRGPVPTQAAFTWIKYNDYPAAAMRKGESGTAGFTLSVDAKGIVTQCAVTSTSGSTVLDAVTCDLLKERATFHAALNAAGKPVAGAYSGAVRWVLPIPSRLAKPGAFSYSYVVGTDGLVSQCRVIEASGTMATRAQTYMGPCPLRVGEAYKDAQGNPVARTVTVTDTVSIDPAP